MCCFDLCDLLQVLVLEKVRCQAQCLSVFQWSCYSVLLQLSVVIQHTQLSHTAVCSLLRVTHTLLYNLYLYISLWDVKLIITKIFFFPQPFLCVYCSQVDVTPTSEEEQTSRSRIVPPLNHWSWWDFYTFCDVLWS